MLPERRKTAEEIAKLREDMGIPGATAAPVDTAPGPNRTTVTPQAKGARLPRGPRQRRCVRSASPSKRR